MNPPRSEGFVRMPDAEFEAILTRAAEEGAKRALADVGLDGDEAALDIRAFLCGAGQDRLELGVRHAHVAFGSGWCHRVLLPPLSQSCSPRRTCGRPRNTLPRPGNTPAARRYRPQ